MTRRVVITGVGVISPIGNSLDDIAVSLKEQITGIRIQEDWKKIEGLNTFLAAPTPKAEVEFSKKAKRVMGRVALMAVRATMDAIEEAGLSEELRMSGRCGVSYGSTQGSSQALFQFMEQALKSNGGFRGVRPTNFIKFMSHTVPVNIASYFSVRGRVINTSTACTSGAQGVGYGYEAVKYGMQDVMIAGGAEELHYSHSGVFDLLRATSTGYNDRPNESPRPFDADRDGLVVGEGAATLILEEYEHAKKRGAHIYAEILGYGTTCDGAHMTSPNDRGMASAMIASLTDAKLDPKKVDYINAHATSTLVGDIAESHATLNALGEQISISSTKGLTAHTLGAAGSIESVICLSVLRDGYLPASTNLVNVDPRCAPLNYVKEVETKKLDIVMNNNFAFGGVNTSIIFKKI